MFHQKINLINFLINTFLISISVNIIFNRKTKILRNFLKQNIFSNCLNTYKLNNQNININNCLISELLEVAGNGGAIYITTSYNMLINDTVFFRCIVSNGYGGALYFYNGLNCEINKTCALYCKANTWQFAYILTQINNKNFLDFVSNSKCYNDTIGHDTLIFYQGIQNVSNLNSSFNQNYANSGFYYFDPTSMNSIYCTFYNNSVKSNTCIQLLRKTGKIILSNFINNNSPLGYGVIFISSNGNYNMIECIFEKNYNTLFYVNTGLLTISNCIINQLNSTITTQTGISIIFSPLRIEITNIYILNHFNKQFLYTNLLISCYNNPLNSNILITNNRKISFILFEKISFLILLNII